ncbi:M56 family metallopeptidase [Lacipirellula sp.]|uniref:M56 family metallopeptidase n=1 Tax=Lacipirellula sp. TaxID=2691419 RepID=UPI003D0FE40F
MDGLISAGLLNAALATLLAGVALIVTVAWKNPYVARLAWLAVLLKLVTPPLLFIPVEVAWLQPSVPSTPTVTVESVAIEPSDSKPIANNVAISAAATAAPATSTTTQTIAPSIAPVAESTAPLPAITPHAFPFTPLQNLAIIWLTGSSLLSLISLTRIVRLHRWLARALPCPTALEQRASALAAELGLPNSPRICIVAGRVAPFAWSLGRHATVVLPAALVDSLNADALDAVIAHELTHLRRRDGWTRWLELAATIAYWWCPTAWFARRHLHAAEEECCDADVLRRFPALRRGYGQALLQTLDLLAGDTALAPGATGWGSRRSLRRRFERIGTPILIQPLSRWSRVFYGAALIVTCLLAPAAATSEPATSEPAPPPATNKTTEPNADNSEPCTITLKDGSVINGVLVERDGARLIVLPNAPPSTPDKPATPARKPTETPLDAGELKHWKLTFNECIHLAIENDRNYRIARNADGTLVISQNLGEPQPPIDFQHQVEKRIAEIAERYWKLRLANQELAARRNTQQAALETWRRVKAKFAVSAEGGTQSEEAQSRGQFFYSKNQVQVAQSRLLVAEAELRSAMGLSANDGRLISASSAPNANDLKLDWESVRTRALTKRIEVREQDKQLKESEAVSEKSQQAVVETEKLDLSQRLANTTARHHDLLAKREAAVLKDLQLSVTSQLASAVRSLDLAYGILETNANRRQASDDEVPAVEATYLIGRVSLDLLLQAQERSADAAIAHEQSLADYQLAILRLKQQQGTLLETYDIRIAE